MWRGARARAEGGGTGLAVVKELVTTHGGTVTTGSGPGGGTRMALQLPRFTAQGPSSFPTPSPSRHLPRRQIPPGVFDAPPPTVVLSPERYPLG
ncbi:ATP-binding protein [Streptomyces sp. NPDC048279]|uniref:ATP-binding protein n=1 Tax=Streptomyces sp. NPDC048279 TaxID=3154714 RepID=UPI003437B40E